MYFFAFGFGAGAAPTQNLPTIDYGNVCNACAHGIGIAGDSDIPAISKHMMGLLDGPLLWSLGCVQMMIYIS
jgi:hypothetical protein